MLISKTKLFAAEYNFESASTSDYNENCLHHSSTIVSTTCANDKVSDAAPSCLLASSKMRWLTIGNDLCSCKMNFGSIYIYPQSTMSKILSNPTPQIRSVMARLKSLNFNEVQELDRKLCKDVCTLLNGKFDGATLKPCDEDPIVVAYYDEEYAIDRLRLTLANRKALRHYHLTNWSLNEEMQLLEDGENKQLGLEQVEGMISRLEKLMKFPVFSSLGGSNISIEWYKSLCLRTNKKHAIQRPSSNGEFDESPCLIEELHADLLSSLNDDNHGELYRVSSCTSFLSCLFLYQPHRFNRHRHEFRFSPIFTLLPDYKWMHVDNFDSKEKQSFAITYSGAKKFFRSKYKLENFDKQESRE